MVKLASGKEIELKPINYMTRAWIIDEAQEFIGKEKMSAILAYQILEKAKIEPDVLEELTFEEVFDLLNQIVESVNLKLGFKKK